MSINNEQQKQSNVIKPYFSCEWIEGGLAFAHDSLHICCEPQGWFHISDFHGGEIPVSAILSAREQLKDDIQKNDRHNCHRCPKLHYQIWEQKRYLVDIINFSHFYLCNLKCNYCYLQIKNIDARNDKSYNVYPILKSMIEQEQISPGVKVFWGGGEPTILKDFDKIIELLSEIQAFQTFNTNSVVFSSAVYNYLEKSDRFFLTTSIDAGTPETFIKIKGADLFHRTVDNLSKYAQAGGDRVAFKIIFTEDNATENEIYHIIKLCKEKGFKKIALDVDNNKDHQGENIIAAMAIMLYEAMENQIDVGIMANPEITQRVNLKLASIYEQRAQNLLAPANEAFQKGDMDTAIQAFTQVTLSMPELVSGYTGLGVSLMKKHRYSEAAPVFLKAARLAPQNPDIFNLLGAALYQIGDLAGAEAAFKAALKLSSNHSGALYNLIDLYRSKNEHSLALPLVEHALLIYPNNPELTRYLEAQKNNSPQ